VYYEFSAYLKYVTDIRKYVCIIHLEQYFILKTGIDYSVLQIVAAVHK